MALQVLLRYLRQGFDRGSGHSSSNNSLTLVESLDESQSSWSSLENDVILYPTQPPSLHHDSLPLPPPPVSPVPLPPLQTSVLLHSLPSLYPLLLLLYRLSP